MPRVLVLFACANLMLSACFPTGQTAVSRLGLMPVLDGGSYSTGGGITVAAEIKPLGGMTALCGVWAESAHQSVFTKGKAAQVMGSGSVYLGDTVLHRGLLFMQKATPSDSYVGHDAKCVKTQRPWQVGDETQPMQIRFPRQVVHREVDDFGGMSMPVMFRQTGPGA